MANDTETGIFTGGDVNAILKHVTTLSASGDAQLSILAYAFVIGCKSVDVDADRAIEMLRSVFEKDLGTIPLASAGATGESQPQPPKIPTLAEWLGSADRASGFEEYVAATINNEISTDNPGMASSQRIVQTLTIAMVEACRREEERGEQRVDVAMRMGGAVGWALLACLASTLTDSNAVAALAPHARTMIDNGIEAYLRQDLLAHAEENGKH